MKNKRHLSFTDHLIVSADQAFFGHHHGHHPKRPYPAEDIEEQALSKQEAHHVVGLMRVNHAGEICAQALYQAQAITARESSVQIAMQQAANEELDHLDWCERRLDELKGRTSYLKPLWYVGSFGLGVIAGLFGDKWNLGFLAETERQVVQHLSEHQQQLPPQDHRSHAVLQQMRTDEADHEQQAIHSGASPLPLIIRQWMRLGSLMMIRTSYWI